MAHDALITADAVAFRDALPDGGRLLGIDLGTKTIGLALCDAGWTFASPAQTLPRGGPACWVLEVEETRRPRVSPRPSPQS